MGLTETELAPPPLDGGVYPHLVGVLTEKVFLKMGHHGSFSASWLMPTPPRGGGGSSDRCITFRKRVQYA